MPTLKEPPPPDLAVLRKLLKHLYDRYSSPASESNRPRISKAKVSASCGMRDPAWLNKVIAGAQGCQNLRTDTMVRFANALQLNEADRKRLARALGRSYAPFASPVLSGSLEAMSMRRAVLLISSEEPRQASVAIRDLLLKRPRISARLSRVFGPHDIILRVTTPPGHFVLPEVLDPIRHSVSSVLSDTLLLRDDLTFLAQSSVANWSNRSDQRRTAYVFLEGVQPDPGELVRGMVDAAQPLAISVLTAGMLVGRFDAVAEVAVERLDHLEAFLQALRASVTGIKATITYPTVRVLEEVTGVSW